MGQSKDVNLSVKIGGDASLRKSFALKIAIVSECSAETERSTRRTELAMVQEIVDRVLVCVAV